MKFIRVMLAKQRCISYIHSDSIIMIFPNVKMDEGDGFCTAIITKNMKRPIYVRESQYEIFRQMKKKGVCIDI